ncbi:hypothetical protein NIES4075_34280 [Tolypothrix sp. NIES-4075]|uniref:hypothetical protein n=1 Tax=Tolypothrix sp. NIES-4075 TaxID=2005459 RepID=UPI000B5C1F9D|nr:hypothetical protein [Tolypothrix sp. NIES-4075]GAX42427.1 hypothetical protein NIES4075_34280 [Tolypothrix sp. NIES-4075]
MGWIFSLSAECGGKTAAEEFSHHFDKVYWVLSNGCQSQCRAEIFQDIEENWWCRVSPSGISETKIETPESAYLMTELGILLYQHLRSSPPFRYALVGVEVDEFRTYDELLQDSSTLTFPGLVLAEMVWQMIGLPQTFRPFSPGYVWKPYEGEVYKPLMASSELKRKLNELLIVG